MVLATFAGVTVNYTGVENPTDDNVRAWAKQLWPALADVDDHRIRVLREGAPQVISFELSIRPHHAAAAAAAPAAAAAVQEEEMEPFSPELLELAAQLGIDEADATLHVLDGRGIDMAKLRDYTEGPPTLVRWRCIGTCLNVGPKTKCGGCGIFGKPPKGYLNFSAEQKLLWQTFIAERKRVWKAINTHFSKVKKTPAEVSTYSYHAASARAA